jgi:hypothetical protein
MKQLFSAFFLFVLTAGYSQVGIGTTSPSEALDIESSDGTKTSIDINNTGAGDPLIHFQLSGTSLFTIGVDDTDSDKFKIGTIALETNTAITINASQQVAIGHAFPSATLDVDGSAIFNESGAAVDFRIEGDGEPNLLFVDGSADAIGIGTNSPTYLLNLYNADAASGFEPIIETNNTRWAGITFKNTNREWFSGIPSGGASRFAFVDNTAGQERVSINSSGYVGINQTSPVSGLDVQTNMGMQVTAITSATTLTNAHNIVLCSGSAFTLTLTAASTNTGKIYYIKKTDGSTNYITIDGNSSETIDGATTMVLYVQYDAVRISCDGSNWHVVADERIPHSAVLRRQATQSITDDTDTKIAFDAEDYDIGEIADFTTNDRIDIKRTGKYLIGLYLNTTNAIDLGEYAGSKIYVNGVSVSFIFDRSSASNNSISCSHVAILNLTAGDYVECYWRYDEGAAINTHTSDELEPRLEIMEMR